VSDLKAPVPDVCDFCQGQPVGNAARWVNGEVPPTAPCPRCGLRHEAPA